MEDLSALAPLLHPLDWCRNTLYADSPLSPVRYTTELNTDSGEFQFDPKRNSRTAGQSKPTLMNTALLQLGFNLVENICPHIISFPPLARIQLSSNSICLVIFR